MRTKKYWAVQERIGQWIENIAKLHSKYVTSDHELRLSVSTKCESDELVSKVTNVRSITETYNHAKVCTTATKKNNVDLRKKYKNEHYLVLRDKV